MANEKLLLQARMRDAGVERETYRKMSVEEMKAHLAKATKPAPAKKTAPTKASNGASAAKAAPAKKTVSKSAPAKKAPASQAKRSAPATATKKTAPAKATATKKAPTPVGAKVSTAKKTAAPKNLPVGRATIDNSKIDWTAESRVGATPGKRQDVMNGLRKHKGNVDKVFESLRENALKWYPNALNSFPGAKSRKDAAEQNLRWLINRVKYDFVSKSGQHVSGTRASFGTSENANAIYQRNRRERLHRERQAAGKAKTPAKRSAPARKAPAASKAPAKKAAPAKRGATATKRTTTKGRR